jgi:hypothetical protein
MRVAFLISLALCIVFSCREEKHLFRKLDSGYTRIGFENTIYESDSFNILDLENIYNGGGVGVADFNNDGLDDLYFTGNMVANRLYVNRGNLKFEDITASAGVEGQGKWSRGVSIVDINSDGWMDIYVSATIHKDSVRRENILYINNGVDGDGMLHFTDLAIEYGLNDNSHTTQTAFFDYDNDGDLDAYLAVNVFAKRDDPNAYRPRLVNGEHPNTDRLYRNDWDSVKGHPYFVNVSAAAGIKEEGFAHSVTICDINLDGWKDVFVTNDYLSENLLYINNRNGTFTNRCREYFKHTSYNSMGADVVDINNDGLSDVIELDMNPEDNYRKKTMLGPGRYQSYINNESYDYQYQYVRNCLHVNGGMYADENPSALQPLFSETAFFSGIAETDWSWTPLVSDFDMDGIRDIIVTNGFPKDITDRDFMIYRNSAFAMNAKDKLLAQIPEVKISNYAFKNLGNLEFANVSAEWGLSEPSFSNGAAAADLDNDGDLEVIINNINAKALVYENMLNERTREQHYLKVRLVGDLQNRDAFGTWIKVYHGNNIQYFEVNPVRGYLSSINSPIYFGLGRSVKVDSVEVIWPDRLRQVIRNFTADTLVQVKYSRTSADETELFSTQEVDRLFDDVTAKTGIEELHSQQDYNDFSIQSLLIHKLSQNGPFVAGADLNNDGLGDFVIGSSHRDPFVVYIQNQDASFYKKPQSLFQGQLTAVSEMGLTLFDADNDNDQDLYVAVGGYYEKNGSSHYRDRLYLNDGEGKFSYDSTAIPADSASNSCVRAADYDGDGDMDLFIGERVVPGAYPAKCSGRILRNDTRNNNVRFTDVTHHIAPDLNDLGLISDAVWTDYNNDNKPDLVIAGEWMPLIFLKNTNGRFINETKGTGIDSLNGFWNCITASDIDKDGDIDLIAGNAGKNTFFTNTETYPLSIYYNDFDRNGTAEGITTKYLKSAYGEFKEYPIHSRDEIMEQLPSLKKRFLSFKSFADVGVPELFRENEWTGTYKAKANYFKTSVVENLGNGRFKIISLPNEVQYAPVNAIVAADFDKDGMPDLLIAGNDYGMEVFNGRADALNGVFLKGLGKMTFKSVLPSASGFFVPGDAESMATVQTADSSTLVVATCNRDSLLVFKASHQLHRD